MRRGHRIEYLSVAEVAVGFEIGADEDLVAGLPYFARELCGYFRKYIDFFAVDVVAAEVGTGSIVTNVSLFPVQLVMGRPSVS